MSNYDQLFNFNTVLGFSRTFTASLKHVLYLNIRVIEDRLPFCVVLYLYLTHISMFISCTTVEL